MRKRELVALRSKPLTWERFLELLPSTLDAIGVSVDSSARDGEITLRDHGELGVVVVMDSGSLAQRAARALAPKLGASVRGYEVVGTSGGKGFKFRAHAFEATPTGELRDAEGQELDFDDPEQSWGGGDLEARSQRVLREFGQLPSTVLQTKTVGIKRRSGGRPSTPRVATLLTLLKKAKAYQGVPQEGGRVELRVELAAGGKQTSVCTQAEFEELERLMGK